MNGQTREVGARMSRLAVASLVLGVVGLPCLFPAALAGLIVGAIAIARINRNPRQLKGTGLAVAGVAVSSVGLALAVVAIASILPALHRARGEAMKARSTNNLHNSIALAIAMYRNDNGGRYPPNLAVLSERDYLDEPGVLVDPADDDPQLIPGSQLRSSYEYIGIELPWDLPASSIIAYSRRGVHPDGRTILYVDLAVGFATEEELHQQGGLRGHNLPEQCAWIEERYGAEIPEEQRRRLREFYEAGPGIGDMFEDENNNNLWDPGEKIIWAAP